MSSAKKRLRLSFEQPRDSTIHPDDWANAIAAWFNTTNQRRKKVSTPRLVQELLLDSARRKYHPKTARMIEQESEINQRFNDQLLRAINVGRRPIFDEIDMRLLSNWRVLDASKELQKRRLPGLRKWHPLAIKKLFDHMRVFTSRDGKSNDDEQFENWFKQRKLRLRLKSLPPYTVGRYITF